MREAEAAKRAAETAKQEADAERLRLAAAPKPPPRPSPPSPSRSPPRSLPPPQPARPSDSVVVGTPISTETSPEVSPEQQRRRRNNGWEWAEQQKTGDSLAAAKALSAASEAMAILAAVGKPQKMRAGSRWNS